MPTVSPKFVAQMVAATVPALTPLVQQIEAMTRASPDQQARVSLALQGLRAGAQALALAEDTSEQLPTLQRIQHDAQMILGVAAALPLPPPANLYLQIGSAVAMMAFSVISTVVTQHQMQAQAAASTPVPLAS